MKQRNSRQVVNDVARWFLALIFVVAAVAKLLDLDQFTQRVGDFGLVYDTLVAPTAWATVLAELLIGVSLILHLRGSLAAAIVLLLLFIAVLAYGVSLGLDIECGCFGPAIRVSLGTQMLTDFGLLVVCAIIYFSAAKQPDANAPNTTENLGTDESL